MEVVIGVRLQRHERRLLEYKGEPHVGVAFPDNEDRAQAIRRIRFLASGDTVLRHHVDEVLDTLSAVAAACGEQCLPEWWHDNVLNTVEGEAFSGGAGVGLVLNPQQFAIDMAENRKAQLRDVMECGTMLMTVKDTVTKVVEAAQAGLVDAGFTLTADADRPDSVLVQEGQAD